VSRRIGGAVELLRLRLYCDCTASVPRGDDKCEVCASVECGWNAGLPLLLPYPQRGLISAKPLSKAGSLHRIMAALTPMTRAHGSGEYYKGKASQAAAQPPSSISEPAPLIHLTSHLPAPKTHRLFVFFLHFVLSIHVYAFAFSPLLVGRLYPVRFRTRLLHTCRNAQTKDCIEDDSDTLCRSLRKRQRGYHRNTHRVLHPQFPIPQSQKRVVRNVN
jgi:hypothetical protein